MPRRPAAAVASCAVVLLLVAVPAAAASSRSLDEAQRALEALDYPAAQRALAEAEQSAGNDLPTTLRILELQGIVAAALGDDTLAAERFGRLLYLSPTYALQQGLSPRLTAPFDEARRAREGQPGLSFDVEVTRTAGATTAEIQVRSDPLALARGVRVRVLSPPPGRPVEAPLLDRRATVALPPLTEEVAVELLGTHGSTVAERGPIRAPVPAAHPAGHSTLRPWAWAAAAGAGATLVTGGLFGLRSRDARAQLLELRSGEQLPDLTQRQAFALNERAVNEARLANGLFVTSAAFAVGAAVLFMVEPPPPAGASVRLLAGPGGVAVTGAWR